MNILADFQEILPESISGIYAFVSEDNSIVYYIGQSVNILNRYRSHSVKKFLTNKSIKFKFIWRDCLKTLLDEQETECITRYKPLLNTILNWDVSNDLKDEYREYINSLISKAIKSSKEIEEVELKSIIESKKCKQKSRELSRSAIEAKVDALMRAIEIGEMYSNIKNLIKSAPNKDTIFETEIGTFTGWLDFLKKQELTRPTVEDYIFMYQHSREFAEMKLISKDPEDLKSGAAGHRKIAAIKAVKWYLEKIANEGEHIRGTLTACDYQREVQSIAKKVKESKYVLREEYEKLKLENMMLRHQLEQLQAKV